MKKAIVLGVIVFALALFVAIRMGRYNYAISGIAIGLAGLLVSALWLEATFSEAARWRTLKIAAASLGLAMAASVAWPLTVAFVIARLTLPYRWLAAPPTVDDADALPIDDDIDDEEAAPPAA